jgi:formyl-CoA transferase
MAVLRASGLPIAPVQTFTEAAQDPHVIERDMLQPTVLPDGTTVPIIGPAVKFSRTPTRVRSAAPALGEHTEDILQEIGIDTETRRRLAEDGITA